MGYKENIEILYENGEVWADIKDFEEIYQVSNYGRIRSVHRKVSHKTSGEKTIPAKIRKISNDAYGYNIIGLWKNNKGYMRKIHRLVAQAFIPNPENKPEVNHKFGIKTDNRSTELEWVTPSENQAHSYAVLKRDGVNKGRKGSDFWASKSVICTTLGLEFGSAREAEQVLMVGRNSISMVCRDKKTSVKGFVFRFKTA